MATEFDKELLVRKNAGKMFTINVSRTQSYDDAIESRNAFNYTPGGAPKTMKIYLHQPVLSLLFCAPGAGIPTFYLLHVTSEPNLQVVTFPDALKESKILEKILTRHRSGKICDICFPQSGNGAAELTGDSTVPEYGGLSLSGCPKEYVRHIDWPAGSKSCSYPVLFDACSKNKLELFADVEAAEPILLGHEMELPLEMRLPRGMAKMQHFLIKASKNMTITEYGTALWNVWRHFSDGLGSEQRDDDNAPGRSSGGGESPERKQSSARGAGAKNSEEAATAKASERFAGEAGKGERDRSEAMEDTHKVFYDIKLPDDARAAFCVRNVVCILTDLLSDDDLDGSGMLVIRLLPGIMDAWRHIDNPHRMDAAQLFAVLFVCEYFRQSFDMKWPHDDNDQVTAVAQLEKYYLPPIRADLHHREQVDTFPDDVIDAKLLGMINQYNVIL